MPTPKGAIYVPVSPELRAFVRERAREEERPMAQVVRRILAAEMRRLRDAQPAPSKRAGAAA